MDTLGIIILVGAVALVAFTIVFNIVRKKKGKGGCCSSSCSSCPSCSSCDSQENEQAQADQAKNLDEKQGK